MAYGRASPGSVSTGSSPRTPRSSCREPDDASKATRSPGFSLNESSAGDSNRTVEDVARFLETAHLSWSSMRKEIRISASAPQSKVDWIDRQEFP
jgi:hypothetical protein